MARRRAFSARGAEAEVLVEHRHQFARGEGSDLRGRQLDRQGQTVERMADRGDDRAIGLVEVIVRPFGRTPDEQLYCRKTECLICVQRLARPRQGQRTEPHDMFGEGAERLAARRQQL